MTLEKKNDWCEWNLWAEFCVPVECIWHRLIELGTKNYWNCQKNWSLTIKQKSIHCMKKVLEIFFSRPIKFLSSANIFFLVNEIFSIFVMIIHLCCHRQKTSEKRTQGVFTVFCFSDSVFHEKTSESKDFWCFPTITQGHETGLSLWIVYLLISLRDTLCWGCKGVENVFFTNSINFHSSFKFFTFFFLVKIAKLFFAMWRNCQTHPRYKNIQNTNRCFWLFSCDCFWWLSRPAFNTC